MEAWQWALAILGGLSALFVFGAVIWGIFDVLRENRLDQTSRILWVIAMFILPLFGVIAWLYAKSRLTTHGNPHPLRKTL